MQPLHYLVFCGGEPEYGKANEPNHCCLGIIEVERCRLPREAESVKPQVGYVEEQWDHTDCSDCRHCTVFRACALCENYSGGEEQAHSSECPKQEGDVWGIFAKIQPVE